MKHVHAGRLLLADTLAIASRRISSDLADFSVQPRLIVDFATLTGTCITSLSNRYIGVMSNRREFVSRC